VKSVCVGAGLEICDFVFVFFEFNYFENGMQVYKYRNFVSGIQIWPCFSVHIQFILPYVSVPCRFCNQEKSTARINSGNGVFMQVTAFCLSKCILRKVNIKICKTTILPVLLYGCETSSHTYIKGRRRCLRTGC
jgi:hypothetical protein